ncbi:MAG: hypothetical protein AAGC71_11825 [Pseudomonadota bacterium]
MAQSREPRHNVNWYQAAGEAVLLFAGVVLALLGQAWWEQRAEQRAVDEYVASLKIELLQNKAGLQGPREDGECIERTDDVWPGVICVQQAQAVVATKLIDLLSQTEPVADSDAILRLTRRVARFDDYRPATSALDNLVGAGGLALLDSSELQLAISNYRQAIEHHNVLQNELAALFVGPFAETLGEHVPLVAIRFADFDAGVVPNSGFEFDPDRLRTEAFENILVRRISAEDDAAEFSDRLVQRIDALLALIDEL